MTASLVDRDNEYHRCRSKAFVRNSLELARSLPLNDSSPLRHRACRDGRSYFPSPGGDLEV